MSRAFGTVELDWHGETHRFRLDVAGIRDLERACDAGLEQILRRLQTGDWRHADVRETLRLGLVGAGLAEAKAAPIVVRLVDRKPLLLNTGPAIEVIAAVLVPFVERPIPGKAAAAETEATAASTSPPSSAPPSP